MGAGDFAQMSFLGGEWSHAAQGRFDAPDYRTAMNVCFNGLPLEEGAWTRRGGTQNASHTRGGAPGRVVKFDFSTVAPYTVELTDGFMRFRTGTTVIDTNDRDPVLAVLTNNPATLITVNSKTWVTGNTVMFVFSNPVAGSIKELANRQFTITRIDSNHFSLFDALTGLGIDGSTLSPLLAGTSVIRLQEIATPYATGSWASVRFVQAETTAVVLQGTIPAQLLEVTTAPTASVQAQFSLTPLTFIDGPYLDPFSNGVQILPGGLTGNVTLTLQFQQWSATQAYKPGDFVQSAAVNYVSLIDNNVNLTPAGNPSAWASTSAGAAINNGQGFLGTDIGRLIRLRSEPAAWNAATAYVAGNLVSYAGTYWTALANNTNKIPGTDVTNWGLSPQFSIAVSANNSGNIGPLVPGVTTPIQTVATWTWGKITGFVNQIIESLAGSVNIGNMTQGGGLAAAFDIIIVQSASQSAEITSTTFASIGTVRGSGTLSLTNDGYVGKNYSGASAQKIQNATIFPSTDDGFNNDFASQAGAPNGVTVFSNQTKNVTLNLRAKATAPASPSDGTLLGSVTNPPNNQAVSIVSNDQVTASNFGCV